MKKALIVFVAALAFGQPAFAKSNEELSDKNVEEILRTGLKDPDSARFRFQKSRFECDLGDGIRGICGVVEINARNSYGGYTGFEKFYYVIDNGRLVHMQRKE